MVLRDLEKNSQLPFQKIIKSTTNSNSASSSEQMIKGLGYGEYTMHCFRYLLRDRLRAIECPTDIADDWWLVSTKYRQGGSGYSSKVIENGVTIVFETLKCVRLIGVIYEKIIYWFNILSSCLPVM